MHTCGHSGVVCHSTSMVMVGEEMESRAHWQQQVHYLCGHLVGIILKWYRYAEAVSPADTSLAECTLSPMSSM